MILHGYLQNLFYTIAIAIAIVVAVTKCCCCSSFLAKTQNFLKNRNNHRISSLRVALICIGIAKLR